MNKNKKVFLSTILAVISVAAYSQPNPKFVELENYCKDMNLHLSFDQINAGEGIRRIWTVALWINQLKSPYKELDEASRKEMHRVTDSIYTIRNKPVLLALDSIRSTFFELSKKATQSYLYEYHNEPFDTIEYSIAFAKDAGDTPHTLKYGNIDSFNNMREVGRLHCHNSVHDENNKGFIGVLGGGRYSHVYILDNPRSWDQLQAFDGEIFQQIISPIFKRALKQKGVKSYPIYWRHDEGYDNEDILNDLKNNPIRNADDNANKHKGLTMGTHYFFPKACKVLAMDVLHQLDSIAFVYVNEHPDQLYSYSKYDNYYTGVWGTMISGSVYRRTKGSVYELHPFLDEDGYHIVSITTIGEYWEPKDWQKLKSWINGKGSERKK